MSNMYFEEHYCHRLELDAKSRYFPKKTLLKYVTFYAQKYAYNAFDTNSLRFFLTKNCQCSLSMIMLFNFIFSFHSQCEYLYTQNHN